MTGTEHALESALAEAWPPAAWRDVSVVVGVSGGCDSVALLRAMAALKTEGPGQFYVAHFNHQLRGSASDHDAEFVFRLCGQLGIVCEIGEMERLEIGGKEQQPATNSNQASLFSSSSQPPTSNPRPFSSEAAAREARYGFFRRTAERLGARYLVTAHTADDQAETILHRVVRGTGIAGLAGMARVRPLGPAVTLIRPLLGLCHRQLLGYLDDLGQAYRHDASNDDLRLTRNRIRHELLPQLAEQFNPNVVAALVRLGQLAGEVQEIVDGLVEDLAARSVRCERPGLVAIDSAALAGEPGYLVRELLLRVWRRQGWPMQAMGLAEWQRLAAMLPPAVGESSPARQTFPSNVAAACCEGVLQIWRVDSVDPGVKDR